MINLFDLVGGRREAAARAANADADRRALRGFGGALGSRTVNPAAQAQAANQALTEQRAAGAQQLAQAKAADQQAQGQAVSGLVGGGLSTLGTVLGTMVPGAGAAGGLAGSAVGQATQSAMRPASAPQRRLEDEEQGIGILGTILGRRR